MYIPSSQCGEEVMAWQGDHLEARTLSVVLGLGSFVWIEGGPIGDDTKS